MEMRAHQIEGGEIADPFIERGGAFQVGEQERQRGDLEALIDVEIIRLEDVAKSLVRQHPLGGQDRLALAEQLMERVVGDPDRGKHPVVGLVFERQPQRPGTHHGRAGRRVQLVEDDGELLALAGRLALDIQKMRRMRHRLEHDHELIGQLQRQHRLLARRQLDRLERDLIDQPRDRFLAQVHPRAPEHLAVIFPDRQRIGIMRRDAPDAGTDGERNLDAVVDGCLIALSA